jgi:amino acid transporter
MAVSTQPGKDSGLDVAKRVLVGRRLASSRLEHTLLPKILALPVFSSDALSSVAYATEEILKVLVVASAAAATLVLPVSVAIALLMLIVVASYRQTVRAYPSGGGAYIVSRENLGTGAGLLAAAALLTDYVLTVSVSTVAGVFAIVSAAPSLDPYRVWMSIGFVVLITLANLRGVRESGTLFAIPTYGFILFILAMVVAGLAECVVGSCPQAVVPAEHLAEGTAASVGLFVILHAFSSGSTALTGVEAISNGVPAFRRPQAKNASTTLAVMAVIAVTMFLGISFLAQEGHAIPAETKSVVAQIADGIFGHGLMYYLIQVFTAAILILAANTSYQDFPRLASILARDRFLPRQFENRGDRLVFSNGVILLAVFACLLIVVFDAKLDNLIQLYVVGVFTSFTLSQAGMVRHWLKVRREGGPAARGWRRSIVINAIGSAATFLVLVVVVSTKFAHGAWIVIAAMPIIIAIFAGIHRHYDRVASQLAATTSTLSTTVPRNLPILVVERLDAATAEAVGYVRGFAGNDFRAVHVPTEGSDPGIRERWQRFSHSEVSLEMLPASDHPTRVLLDHIRSIPRAPIDFVNVVIPELLKKDSLLSAVGRTTFNLKLRLLPEPQVVVTDVPVIASKGGDPVGVDALPLIPQRTVAMVFVSGVNMASMRAIDYARSLKATQTRAVFFALYPEDVPDIIGQWTSARIPIELDIVEAPFRDLGPPVLEEVRKVTAREDSVAAVVLPEIVPTNVFERILHNQRALFIKRLLLFEPRVILSSVPTQLKKEK